MHYKKPVTHVESHASAVSLLESGTALDKSDQQKNKKQMYHQHITITLCEPGDSFYTPVFKCNLCVCVSLCVSFSFVFL